MSDVTEKEVSHFSRLAKSWWDKQGPLKTLHDINPTRLMFIQNHKQLSGQKILDVGCGGGILSESMAIAGAKVTGIDLSKEAIAAAIAHAKESQLSIDYHSEALDCHQGDDYDIITCLDVLEHTDDFKPLIDEAIKRLRPGGHLFLSSINRTPKAYLLAIVGAEYLLKLLPKQTHHYQQFIRPSELTACLRQHPLTIFPMKGLSYHPFSRQSALTDDLSVNYFIACQKQTD